MKTIWVLGNGQLGAMLKHAAMPLCLDVKPVDITSDLEAELGSDDIITAEREHWPNTPTARTLFNHPNFINRRAFVELPDRKRQKQLYDKLGLATAPWRDVDKEVSAEDLYHKLGERVLLKRRTGGYDGKGQLWLGRDEQTELPESWRDCAIAEQAINFSEEASIIGVRGRDGSCHFYPLILNLHTNGILTASIAPFPRLAHLQEQAEQMLGKLMAELEYIGVMAMECFVVDGRLMINEVAPRVHNSGHWTQAGNSVSQFEYHLRAVADLPLAAPRQKNSTVMLNLIGTEHDQRWLTVPGAEVFWYGKGVLPGRKVGHINLCPGNHGELTQAVEQLRPLLPDRYAATFDWVLGNI